MFKLKMIRGENSSDSIPTDLIMEILSRLPAKSVRRFFCVLKLWESMLNRPYFTELFLTRSSARPRLLFAVEGDDDGDWCFFSSLQPHNPYKKSSPLVVAADSHMKLPGDTRLEEFCGHASGLFFCRRVGMVICNPSTGQYAYAPLPKEWRFAEKTSFLGFDPINKQFKVLSIDLSYYEGEIDSEIEETDQILTLGTGDDSWRKIHCPLDHLPLFPLFQRICINGVLYYLAEQIDDTLFTIVCFDVRSEKFKFICIDFIRDQLKTKLINYKGKLGVITLEFISDYNPGGLDWDWHSYNISNRPFKLFMWVIKDVEKPESGWSEYAYSFCEDQVVGCNNVSVFGVTTATGEIVLSMSEASDEPFYVFYLNPERNTLQRVEIRGLGSAKHDAFDEKSSRQVRVFVDHVEDLKFINMKTTYNPMEME